MVQRIPFSEIRSKNRQSHFSLRKLAMGILRPIKHPSFTYAEFDYLLIIASPSHAGHVPFEKIICTISQQANLYNPILIILFQADEVSYCSRAALTYWSASARLHFRICLPPR